MLTEHAFNSGQHKPLVFSCAAALVMADQAIKVAVAWTMPLGAIHPISTWFNWVHVLNPGAAFSFLADAGGWQKHFLSLFAVVVSAILARLLWTGVRSKVESVAYVFLMGGALGNVIDRLRIGAVIDYIDLHWHDWHWPAFNFADIFVMSGAFLLLVTSFGVDRTESQDPR